MEIFEQVADGIHSQGWLVLPQFIDAKTISALNMECQQYVATGALRRAAVGHDASQQIRPELRNDDILWIDPARSSDALTLFLVRLEQLRQVLNLRLQLGLFEFECHYSRYAKGAYYRKHIDRFQNDSSRILSSVLYLNHDWQSGDGGELRLYLENADPVEVKPEGGTLVLFLSARFAHEVLPARRERLSLTGWFRSRA